MNLLKKFLKKTFYIPGMQFQKWDFKLPDMNIKFGIPSLFGFTFPTMNIGWPKWAGIRLKGGMWKVGAMATVLGIAATAGIFFATTAKLDAAPTWPQAAEYNAQVAYDLQREKLHVGTKNVFADDVPEPQRHTQTLKVLVGGARMSEVNFDTISLGKASGLAIGLQIVGTSANTLQCEEIVIDGLEAPSFNLENSNVYQLVVQDNTADGLSISPAISSTPQNIQVGSSRGALSIPAASESTYDRIIIDTQTADSICEKLTLKNIKLYGTYSGNSVDIQNIDVGKLTIKNSIIGDGTGIDTASFTIATSTAVSIATLSGNIEKPIAIK